MANFKIGDRVVYQGGLCFWNGKHGTICARYHGTFGVRFDEPVGKHSCAGTCEEEHGAWLVPDHLVYETDLSSIPEEKLLEVIFSGI